MSESKRATVFLDWDTCRRVAAQRGRQSQHVEEVVYRLQDFIANRLCVSFGTKEKYRVDWRVYHGWYSGKTKTQDRISFDKFSVSARSRILGNIYFGSDYGFGDLLSCGTFRSPLYDSLRYDEKSGEKRQKMVDTALTCDLLHLVRSKHSDVYIVIGNDDDLLPAVFTAEAWKAKVMLLHTREHTNSFLKLNGISYRLDGK